MKKALIALVIAGLLGAGGYGAYHHFFEQADDGAQRVSSTSEDAVYVDQVSVITGYGSGNGLVDRFGGEVEPQATLEVKLENEKTVKECFVKEGDEVKAGQKLFCYDTQDDEDKLTQAEIDIEKAKGEIEVSEKAIEQYEKEKQKADSDEQLTYTTSILTEQNEIKRNEYEIKTLELQITQLKDSIANSTVTAEMAGVVQKISDPGSSDSSVYGYGSGSDSAYITILETGDFRIKGTINEQNISQIDTGMPMIIYSRVDSTKTWQGIVSEVKTDAPEEDSSDNSFYYGMGSDTGSSNYAFYVELESSEGLMLGQHVYMEADMGQNEKKDGLWLEEYYIVQEDDQAYVWRASEKNLIEKCEVTLGEYDEDQMKYEILDGLSPEDYIAFPMENVQEGNPVIYNDFSAMEGMAADGMDGFDDMDGYEDGFDDMDIYDDTVEEDDIDSQYYDMDDDAYYDVDSVDDDLYSDDEWEDADLYDDDEFADEDVYDADEEVYDADADEYVYDADDADDSMQDNDGQAGVAAFGTGGQ